MDSDFSLMLPPLPSSWQLALAPEFEKLYWSDLTEFIKSEYSQQVCFPQERYIFRAFEMTPFDRVRVVILGQDPYHSFANEKFKMKNSK